MYIPEYNCDLHTHSLRSDGNDTVKELIDLACSIGMKAIALTDHDVCPPKFIEVDGEQIGPGKYAMSKGLVFIPGIEFSCETYVDDVHIIGLGCDFDSNAIKDIEQDMALSKVDGYKKLVEVLKRDGMDISWDDITRSSGVIRNDDEVQRKHIFETIAARGYAKSWNDAKRMVRENPKYNIRRRKVEPAMAIRAIQDAGGISILAHPYLIDEVIHIDGVEMTRKEYIDSLIQFGLQGIEAMYTYDKTSYKGTISKKEIEMAVRQKYEHQLPLISGGSDYHGDIKKGVNNPRRIGEAGISYEYFSANRLLKGLI